MASESPILQGNLLDRAIEAIFPKWGAERLAHREVLRFGYRSARSTRLRSRGTSLTDGPDGELEQGWDRVRMVNRSRQLERDSALACGLFDRATDNVIGPNGIRPRSVCSDESFRMRSQDMFLGWASSRDRSDIRGMANFWEQQRLLYRSKKRDGDVGVIKISTGHMQGVEGHQITSPSGVSVSRTSVDGIDLDSRGRPQRFHVTSPSSERGGGRLRTTTIPGSDMIFDARRLRLNQTRGTPTLAGTAHVFDQVDGYLEAVITAARMSACFGLVFHSKKTKRGLKQDQDADGNLVPRLRVEPARIWRVDPADKVTQIKPEQPGTQFAEITATFGRLVGIPFGMPLEIAFMDFSRTNYSSARAALLQAYRAWRVDQSSFVAGMLVPIWEWKIGSWIDEGLLTLPAGLTRDQALAHEWDGPGWSWIDPLKEIEAALMAVDGGLDTLQDLARRMGGGDWFKLLERRAQELGAIEEAGIQVSRSIKTRPEGYPVAPGDTDGDGVGSDEDQDN